MSKKVYSFVETTDEGILKDLEDFDSDTQVKGSSGSTSVSVISGGFIIKVEKVEETFFFALSGETMDEIVEAISDMNKNLLGGKL